MPRLSMAAAPGISKRLIATREALGLRPSQFCEAAGIPRTTYSNWESGEKRPGLSAAIKLVKVHGLTLDWIYLGDPSGLPTRISSKLPADLLTGATR